MTHAYVATVARGLEEALASELTHLELDAVEAHRGHVRFRGPLASGYRACLWSRIASRILLQLGQVPARSGDALYEGVRSLPWLDHIPAGATLAVVCVGGNASIRHTHYGALKVKDAICDTLREATGSRPDIDRAEPDVQVHVHISGDLADVAIDLSGRPLHFRDRGRDGGPAPLKETLAAGILEMARWHRVAADGGLLVDPMAGSGTLVIEAADIVRQRAPGLRRLRWGFVGWAGHEAATWAEQVEEARDRLRPAKGLRVFASDRDKGQVKRLRENLERAGMRGEVKVRQCELSEVHPPSGARERVPRGLLVTNPPYGVRLGDPEEVAATWRELGNVLRRRFLGWEGWLLAGEPKWGKKLGLRPRRRHVVYNGPLEARLLEVPIRTEPVARDRDEVL